MRQDEEEILIRDDSGLLYDDSVTVSVRPRPADWCHKLNKTLCLSLAFFVLGLCIAVPGPTLLDLAEKIDTDISHISTIFSARAVGYLLGAILGGALFNYFDKQLLMFCTLLMCSVATVAVPWCFTLVAMGTLVALQGVCLGILYTGGNMFCVRLWGRKNAPYLQTLHFAFAIGAFLAPILAKPFLSNESLFANTTAVTNDETNLLNGTRDTRSAFYNEHLYNFHEGSDFDGINGLKSLEFLSENKNRYKRDNPLENELSTTTANPTVIKSSIPAVNISKNTSVTQNPVTGFVLNATQTGTKAAESVTKTTRLPTTSTSTASAKKPPVASDAHLKEHTADAKQLSDLKTESDDTKVGPQIPYNVNNDDNDKTTVTETPNPSSSATASPAGNNITVNQSKEGVPAQIVPPTIGAGLTDGNRALKNETEIQSTDAVSKPVKDQSSTGATIAEMSTSAKTSARTTTLKPTTTTANSTTTITTTASPTTKSTTTTTTTTTTSPTTTATTTPVPPTTTTASPTKTTAKKQTSAPETPKPSEATKRTSTSPPAATEKSSTEIPSTTKTLNPVTETSGNTSKSVVSSTAVMSTETPKKPTTAEDIFNKAISLVKTISKIQFVYAIIGTVSFVSSVVFLILYCRNRKRLTLNGGNDYYEGIKSNGCCFKGTVLFMLFLFFICYIGLEAAYGGLVTTFAVRFNHWPKEQGAIVTAIFWGSVAAGRGISIFIARCCRPTALLAVDLSLMVLGGLVLSVGTYFKARLLWLGSLILGLGMSSVLPGIISWTESYFSTAGKATAVYVMGSVLGEMFTPILTTYLFTVQDEMVLMRLALALSAILLVLFIVMSCYAAKKGETYTVRDRNGFLPLQAEDNDNDENVEMDLMDFDLPKSRQRKSKRTGDSEYKTLISDLEED